MATTITDLVEIETFTEAVIARFAAGMDALWGTQAVITNNTFPGGQDTVGTEVNIPYFGSIGEWESISDGSAFTPRKITQTSEKGMVKKVGIAFSITDWANMAAAKGTGGKDPYEAAAEQAISGFAAKVDQMLIEAACAALPSMTVDVYNATTPRTLDDGLVIDGRSKWGDEAGERALLVAHSKVENDLWRLKDTTGRTLIVSQEDGGLNRFMGYPVGMSDRLVPSTDTPPKFTTVLAKPGALVCWYNGTPVVENDRDILSGTNVLVVSTYAVVHRYTRLPAQTKPGVVLLKHN